MGEGFRSAREERRTGLFMGSRDDIEDRESISSTRSGHRTRICRRSWVWKGSEAHVGQRVVDGMSVRARGRGRRVRIDVADHR